VLLLVLAIAWAAVLLPPYLRKRRHARLGDSISLFNRHLSVLERTAPTGSTSASLSPMANSAASPLPVPRSAIEAQQRRREVLAVMGAAVLVSLAGAALIGGLFVVLHVLIDIVALGYVVLLARLKRVHEERAQKVRTLPVVTQQTGRSAEPVLLRSSGS
jgi:hypothetical protein